MFIEKLWEEKPKFVEKATKKILGINEDVGERIEAGIVEKDCLIFDVYNEYDEFEYNVFLKDFSVRITGLCDNGTIEKFNTRWIKFMYNVFGDKYALQYIAHRNKRLDEYMAKYKNTYENQTAEMLDIIGFDVNKLNTK